MWHLSVDIETMGKAPTGAIIAVGARLFNKDEIGRGFEVFIDPQSARAYGDVDNSTMDWWAKQDGDVYQQVFGGRIPSSDAALRFVNFVTETKPETIWAYPPQFDLLILQHWFDKVGLKWPFHYRAERCARTMRAWGEAFGLQYDDCYGDVTKHLPLDDATAQARVVQKVMGLKVSLPKRPKGKAA